MKEVDGSGLQLLAALTNMDLSWRLVDASPEFSDACRTLGLTDWLRDLQSTGTGYPMTYRANDADQDFIAAALPAFISEAVEQTETIETLLLELEEHPDDREMLDALFRCAHTVKGSAGILA